jgi:tetratricopeptide (TPR) repeat protein
VAIGSRRELAICAALGAAVLAVYGQTVGFEFVNFDDGAHVTRNRQVLRGLSLDGFVWAFGAGGTGNWHPLTWLSHMLDAELFGTHAGGHHATSALLHLANTLLLLGALRAATGAVWCSGAVAALFALHPLHVESVAWVSERRDVLSTAFGLLAIWAYVGYARRGGAVRYLGVALLFALSLMAKPMLVTLPCVLLLLDYWPLRRARPGRLVLEKVPLLLLAAACAVATVVLQQRAGAIATVQALPLELRAANAVVAYSFYLLKLIWPARLAMFYPHPYIAEAGGLPLPPWQIAGAAALLASASVLALRARQRPYLAVGWLWYLGTLVPVIGLVQVGNQAYADRYAYFPSIGPFLAVVWGGADLLAAARPRWSRADPLAASAVGACLLALGVCAWLQTRHWRDSASLFQHTVEAVPRNPTIRYNVANHLRDRGRLEEAIGEYTRALEETPDAAEIRVNLANVLRSQGKLEEAALHYRRVLDRHPDDPLANNGLATVRRVQGSLDEAERLYRRAFASDADSVAGYNLGNLLRQRGRNEEAVAVYRESLRYRPSDPKLHNNLAAALEDAGDAEAALAHYTVAVHLDPDYAMAQNNLGALLHRRGEIEPAAEHYRSALRSDPGYRRAHANLASALEEQGRLEEAIEHYRRALELAPEDPLAQRSLDRALARWQAQPRAAGAPDAPAPAGGPIP